MKTLIIVILLSCIGSGNAQNGWAGFNPGFGHSYYSVHFVDAKTGFACGSGGAMVKSTDGGVNWVNITTGTIYTLMDVKLFTPDIAVAVGDNQTIIRTTNGGANWYLVYQGSPVTNKIVNLKIHNGTDATAYSWYYSNPYEYTYVYRTTNLGANWSVQQVYVPNRSIDFIDVNTGWAYGTTYIPPPANVYYLDINKTTNGGTNWTRIYRTDGTSINPGLIYFYNSSFGFKYTHIGNVYLSRSFSGGTSWQSSPGLPSNYTNLIRSFYFVDVSTGWFVGDNSTIWWSPNSGGLWTQQACPVSANLQQVFFINENTGWIAASSQGILKTTNGGNMTGIVPINNNIPNSFRLYQNYPNPFNPVTKIRFDISPPLKGGRGMMVSLIIYNALSKEVETIHELSLQPGTYEVSWDATNYPSGVYYYKFTVETGLKPVFTESRKMILLK